MASLSFCRSCGKPQPDAGKFCTSCGAPIDRTVAGALAQPGMGEAPAPQPGTTARLPESATGGALNSTVAVPASMPTQPTPAASSVGVAPLVGRAQGLKVGRLAIGAAVLVLLLVEALLVRGLLFGGGKGIDRMVTLTRSPAGDITMVLMHSDGSNKVTLVDQSATTAAGTPDMRFSVVYSLDETPNRQIRSGDAQGAAILAPSGRILFWYPTGDGMDINSVNLDGGDMVKLRHAAPVDVLIIPASGDKLLLRESERSSRLLLLDLQGQATTLVPDAAEANATIAPDGKHIAYWQRDSLGSFKLTVVDEHGANPVEVAHDMQQASADFSADSSKLFITLTNEQGTLFQVANADGQGAVILSRTASSGHGEVANNRLIYQLSSAGENSLFTSDLNGEDRVELMRGATSILWSLTPDRKRIMMLSKRNNRYALQVTDFKHEQVQDIKRGDSWIFWNFLDNGRLLLRRSNTDSSTTISTIQLDGTDEQILKRDLHTLAIAVAGDEIVVGGQQANDQTTLALFGAKDTVTLDDEANGYSTVRFTPDGRVIYTSQFNSSSATYAVDRNGKNKKLLFEDATIVATGF